MATASHGTVCVKCKKTKRIVTCKGCSKDFCIDHINEHHNELSEQFGEAEDQFNRFKIEIEKQKSEPQKHALMKQIDEWEYESIEKVKRVANEVRRELLSCFIIFVTNHDSELKKLAEQLIQCRRENDFAEADIKFFNEELKRLQDMLNNPPYFKIEYNTTSFINRICFKTEGFTNPVDTTEITNTTNVNHPNESTNDDEIDAGETYRIQRVNSIIVPTNNDKYAGTICCHDNQLIYNDYDRRTQSFYLTFIPDINVLRTKHNIYRYEPDVTSGPSDDELIQDIVYSNKLSGYLVLNCVRLRLFRPNTNDLIEFQTFGDRTMKRLSCSDTFIYLVVARNTRRYNGDEILLIDYNKEEQACKTFHDVMPHRINRGTGPIVGNISDLAVGSNEQVTIGYRLESRHEVGICLFKVSNYGRAWTLIKHLLLDDCWRNDLSCTPRVEWCEKLNVIIVIEYMTGHLIMLDQNGLVKGECPFRDVENPHEAPINLSISTNAWLCARYESSIVIHKITS